jgi:hypothetical protein
MLDTEARPSTSSSPSFAERFETGKAGKRVAWASLVFSLLQSVCTAVAGLQVLRLAIGVTSLAFSGAVIAALDWLHADRLRVPMEVLAVAGSLLNIVVLLQVMRLRHRSAGNWRKRERSAGEKRAEAWQWALSIVTLISVAAEEYFHLGFAHHL